MKFSIIVPVYNAEKYLQECVQSVLNQTNQEFELILVDDGSTDSSTKICDNFQEKYPTNIKVIHKKNQGPLAARIEGISKANGEFVIFMDADDFIEESALEIINEYLLSDEQVDVLVYSFRYYKNDKKENRFRNIANDGKIWSENNKKEIYEKLAYSMELNSLWTKVIRLSLLKADTTDYSFYFGKNMAEDLLFSLYSMTYARKIMYADKVLYNYRINEEGLAHSFTMESLTNKNARHVYEKILEYFPQWGMESENEKNKLVARWFSDVMYIMSKCYEQANKKDRKLILEYKWDNLLPTDIFNANNLYVNSSYRELYYLLKKEKKKTIQIYFLKKKYYRKLREWKRKIIK